MYRNHSISDDGTSLIKDLTKIGRDIKKSIIIDDKAKNFAKTPDNGIEIKAWYSDKSDRELKKLIPLLHRIVKSKEEDVRPVLKKYNKTDFQPL